MLFHNSYLDFLIFVVNVLYPRSELSAIVPYSVLLIFLLLKQRQQKIKFTCILLL